MKQIAANNLPTRRMSFCTDDKHLADIREEGISTISSAVRSQTAFRRSRRFRWRPSTPQTYGIRHYGAVAPGYRADLVLFDNLTDFNPSLSLRTAKVFEPSVDTHIKPDPKIYNSVHLAPRKRTSSRCRSSAKANIIRLILKNSSPRLADVEGLYRRRTVCAEKRTAQARGARAAPCLRPSASAYCADSTFKTAQSPRRSATTHLALVVVGDNDDDMLRAVDALEECGGGYVVVSNGEILAKLVLSRCGTHERRTGPEHILKHRPRDLLAAAAPTRHHGVRPLYHALIHRASGDTGRAAYRYGSL
ncbi:MAG: adenine deaminase C-terminal domain-containing protein [Eubacteriales bacterium]